MSGPPVKKGEAARPRRMSGGRRPERRNDEWRPKAGAKKYVSELNRSGLRSAAKPRPREHAQMAAKPDLRTESTEAIRHRKENGGAEHKRA